MRISIFVLLVFTLPLAYSAGSREQKGKRWALLAATSNGWLNYRHQADLCHAYQLLRENGFSKDNIITMMYDDIANNTENPNKGVIINKPDGPNVYDGVIKDYTGKDVNVNNFFNILGGNKEAMKNIGSGRVIESGPDDHIFVYIVDHGDTGILLFPNDEYMYAKDLNEHIRQMRKKKHFGKMLMYIEACKAGSMFDNLLDDGLNVFVTTASATNEFSFATYCDTMATCLGDLYSTIWMEHMDLIREQWSASYTTLFKQYKYIRTNVQKSHVMMYGDFRLGFDKASAYLGDNWTPTTKNHTHLVHKSNPVHSKEIPLYLLKQKIVKSENNEEVKRILKQIDIIQKNRHVIDQIFGNIVKFISRENEELHSHILNENHALNEDMFDCYKEYINILNENCFNTFENTYSTKHFYKLANMCILDIPKENFVDALQIACSWEHKFIMNTE